MAEHKTLHPALRSLQLLFAIIVMGTDGYAIHTYRGHDSIVHTPTGDFSTYAGVPNAWGFLMFCAAWTVLAAVFHLIAANAFAHLSYVPVAVEVVGVLSWFAGWIAVAVNIGTGACAEGVASCGALQAAVVFGAVEWLLFMATTVLAFSRLLSSKRQFGVGAVGSL